MQCSGCGRNSVISDPEGGEFYCQSCGLVAEQGFDYSMHWYGDEGTSYAQTSFAKAYKGLGTVDPNGLPRHKGMDVAEEEKIERNFSNALPTLHAVWGLWRIPSYLREECAIRYRRLIRKGVTHGRNSCAMSIAATVLVCREYGIVRDAEELTKTMDLSPVAVSKCLEAMGE